MFVSADLVSASLDRLPGTSRYVQGAEKKKQCMLSLR